MATAAMVALSVMQGLSQSQAIEAQTQASIQQQTASAQAADYNAQVARQNAALTRGQTQAEVEKQDRERRLRAGANFARAGASGVSGGSALDVMADNVAQETMDILTIRQQGLMQEKSFINQADMQEASARGARAQIPLIKAGGSASKTGALLGGASKAVGFL